MKKTYISPALKVWAIKPVAMLATSGVGNGGSNSNGGPTSASVNDEGNWDDMW